MLVDKVTKHKEHKVNKQNDCVIPGKSTLKRTEEEVQYDSQVQKHRQMYYDYK